MARPTVMTEEMLAKLKMAFLIGASDREACAYAELTPSILYTYQKLHPEYVEQKEQWKETPILKARQELVKGLNNNPELSLKYLERKLKNEFSLRNELTGKDGEKLEGNKIVFENFSDATKSK
jgi:hypothetical protein